MAERTNWKRVAEAREIVCERTMRARDALMRERDVLKGEVLALEKDNNLLRAHLREHLDVVRKQRDELQLSYGKLEDSAKRKDEDIRQLRDLADKAKLRVGELESKMRDVVGQRDRALNEYREAEDRCAVLREQVPVLRRMLYAIIASTDTRIPSTELLGDSD